MLVSYAADGVSYGIYRYDPAAKRLGPRVFDDPDWADMDPQAVLRRPEPQGRITIVVDSKDTGDIQCLNVYDSDNPRMRRVEKGSVKRVRVIEGLARRESRTPLDTVNAATRVRLIGEAPVQPDGSFYLRAPADMPISFQMLDEHGFSLVSMGTWVWVRRGDMRGCIGCHENKELAPENRVPLALKLLHEDVLLPTPEARMTADFRSDIAPIMSRSCAGCHRANHPTGLDLADDGLEAIYRRLLTGASADGAPLVRPGYARESMLAWRVLGRRLERTADSLRRMPPGMSLPEDEIRTMCL